MTLSLEPKNKQGNSQNNFKKNKLKALTRFSVLHIKTMKIVLTSFFWRV